tara:strand:+ start:43 stop:399 length:357 start_codon:yes stop_codon:yes gene_type:complete
VDKAAHIFNKVARKKKNQFWTEGRKDIAAGLTAGAVSTGTVFPLDTMTTAAQSEYARELKKKTGKPLTPKSVLKSPSLFPKLYKGIQYKWMKTIPGTAVTLATYGGTKRYLDKRFPTK